MKRSPLPAVALVSAPILLAAAACAPPPAPATETAADGPTLLHRAADAMEPVPGTEIGIEVRATGTRVEETTRISGTGILRAAGPGDVGTPMHLQWIETPPGAPSRERALWFDGTTVTWFDREDGTARSAPYLRTGAILIQARTDPTVALLSRPEAMLNLIAYAPRRVDDREVDGVSCAVVEIEVPAVGPYRLYLGRDDHRPRRVEQVVLDEDGGEAGATITDLTWTPLDDPPGSEVFRPSLPEGVVARTWFPDGPAPGTPAPPWPTDGPIPALADLAGRVVLVDFWASWCAPCKDSIPGLAALVEGHGTEAVSVVGFAWNDPVEDPSYLRELGGTWPSMPAGDETAAAYGIETYGVPALYVIGPDGRVDEAFVGYHGEATDRAVRERVARLLAGSNDRRSTE